MEEHDHDHNTDAAQDDVSFWDLPPDQLNWFGKILHKIRDWFIVKKD